VTNDLALQSTRYYILLVGELKSGLVLKVQRTHIIAILPGHWPKAEI